MSPRELEQELPAPIPISPNMPKQLSPTERLSGLVWLAVALYFLYELTTR